MATDKDYCDFATCVALKELGYNYPLELVTDYFGVLNTPFHEQKIHLYNAQKWLREEKGIIISPAPYEDFKWCACIYCIKFPDKLNKEFDSYEEALSEGIKETIKILKNGNNL